MNVRPALRSLLRACRLPVALMVAASILMLSACGGSSHSAAVTPPPASARCTAAQAAFIFADTTAAVGKTTGAAVGSCGGEINNVSWTQTAGPAVELFADQTPAISFDAPSAGSYQFNVNYQIAGALPRTAVVSIPVSAAASAASTITVRGDHAVRKGGNVSLRAWLNVAAGQSVQSIEWTQIEGPSVSASFSSDQLALLFKAPDVSADTLLRFRATLTTTQGSIDSDEVAVLVENYNQAPSDANGTLPYVFSDLHVSRVYPYRATGPFASALVRCTYSADLQFSGAASNLCSLTTLPFLHQTTNGDLPTTNQIMDRVVVSHDWMGQVFEQFLNSANATDDLKRMFNGVTAIVIGAQVRPSFYYALTGAIYLDADNFWLTAAQRDVINEAPDFRLDFDRDLQYSGLWRYAFNNANIFQSFPLSSRIGRPLDYLLAEAGWLMYHELGHASDFLPPASRGSLNTAQSAWGNISARFNASALPSDTLAQTYPLQSTNMRALAQIKFLSGPASNDATPINGISYGTLKSFSPQQVANFFSNDRASDEYAYSSTREDIAMLNEEFLMYRNHQFRRDVAITDKITAGTTSNTLLVRWGQRGRIGEAAVRQRLELVRSQLTPWVGAGEVSALPAPIPMRAGESWNANVALPAPLAANEQTRAAYLPHATDFDTEHALLMRALTRGLYQGTQSTKGSLLPVHGAYNERAFKTLRQQKGQQSTR